MPGKKEASLNNKLKNLQWGEFNLKELFGKATRGKRLKSLDRINGKLPFVTAGESNEGISAFIGNNVEVFSDNTITIDMFGSAKYRGYRYGADDHVAVVHTENISKPASMFITTSIHKASYTGKFDYSRNFYAKDADELNIQLPVKDGEIDFKLMSAFITELEAQCVAVLEAYLSISKLENYELSNEEVAALERVTNSEIEFIEVPIVDIFYIKNTKSILAKDIKFIKNGYPYVTAGMENNSVVGYVEYDKNFLDKGNCVFIGGKTFTVTYQAKDFYSNDSHNLALYNKNIKLVNRMNQLYFVTCVRKSLQHKYSWGDSVSRKKIDNDYITVPMSNGKIDYNHMETLISAIHKLVIKDVILYIKEKSKLIR